MEIKDIQETIRVSIKNVGIKIYKIFAIYVGILLILNIIVRELLQPISKYSLTVLDYLNNGNSDIPKMNNNIYFSILFLLIISLLIRLIAIGWSATCLKVSRGVKDISFHDLSSMFPRFWKVIVIYLLEAIAVYFGLLVFILPGLYFLFRWSMSFYVLIEHPEYGPIKCMRQSSRLMQGEVKNLLRLGFSFIVQYIVALALEYISSGLVSLWKVPPLAIGYAAFYNRLVYWKPAEEIKE